MPELARPLSPPLYLERMPASADDVVVMVADILYEYLPEASGISPKEALSRVLEVLETPVAIEIIENELKRRQPRDADQWH